MKKFLSGLAGTILLFIVTPEVASQVANHAAVIMFAAGWFLVGLATGREQA